MENSNDNVKWCERERHVKKWHVIRYISNYSKFSNNVAEYGILLTTVIYTWNTVAWLWYMWLSCEKYKSVMWLPCDKLTSILINHVFKQYTWTLNVSNFDLTKSASLLSLLQWVIYFSFGIYALMCSEQWTCVLFIVSSFKMLWLCHLYVENLVNKYWHFTTFSCILWLHFMYVFQWQNQFNF